MDKQSSETNRGKGEDTEALIGQTKFEGLYKGRLFWVDQHVTNDSWLHLLVEGHDL